MSARAPTDRQVYIDTAASEQKIMLIHRLEYSPVGKEKAVELFRGITKFLSQDPFSFKSTNCVNEEKGIFITKNYSGIEPFVVTFVFSDSHRDGRKLLRVRVIDAQGNVLVE